MVLVGDAAFFNYLSALFAKLVSGRFAPRLTVSFDGAAGYLIMCRGRFASGEEQKDERYDPDKRIDTGAPHRRIV